MARTAAQRAAAVRNLVKARAAKKGKGRFTAKRAQVKTSRARQASFTGKGLTQLDMSRAHRRLARVGRGSGRIHGQPTKGGAGWSTPSSRAARVSSGFYGRG